MEYERLTKQPKLSAHPPPSKEALHIINMAKKNVPSEFRLPTALSQETVEWNALEVVYIHLVFSERDLIEATRTFKPKLAHQIFGQKEKLFGYMFPKIHLYFLANSAKCFVKFTHKGICNRQIDLVNAKIFDNLIAWLPEDYCTDERRFTEEIRNECHTKMFGTKIMDCELFNYKLNTNSKFIINECSVSEPGFVQFHERFQCLIVWYIDAASQLDLDDPNWMFVYVYEEICDPHTKQIGYYPIGYSAIYKFFHFPDKIRARISQCFIVPCCQRMGVGFKLLNATYQAIGNLPNAVDITVEDPCTDFQRLRDTVDASLLIELDCFKYSMIKNGFSKVMTDTANDKYKINKRQCRRIFHIICMGYVLLKGDREEDDSLVNDIRCYLGLPPQVSTPTTSTATQQPSGTSEQEVKVPIAVEKYTNEIRPIAWRISKLLKADKI